MSWPETALCKPYWEQWWLDSSHIPTSPLIIDITPSFHFSGSRSVTKILTVNRCRGQQLVRNRYLPFPSCFVVLSFLITSLIRLSRILKLEVLPTQNRYMSSSPREDQETTQTQARRTQNFIKGGKRKREFQAQLTEPGSTWMWLFFCSFWLKNSKPNSNATIMEALHYYICAFLLDKYKVAKKKEKYNVEKKSLYWTTLNFLSTK